MEEDVINFYAYALDTLVCLQQEKLSRGDSRTSYDRHLAIAITETEKLVAYISHFLVSDILYETKDLE